MLMYVPIYIFVFVLWFDKYQYITRPVRLCCQKKQTGGRLNKKDGLTRYGDSHVKDKTS